MSYHCPKCHCGCMFEDRGKMVCMNCGHTCAKSAAEGVAHVHTYTTYTGKHPEKATKVSPAQRPNPAPGTTGSTPYRSTAAGHTYGAAQGFSKKPQGRRPAGCSAAVLIFAVIFLLPFLFNVVSSLTQSSQEPSFSTDYVEEEVDRVLESASDDLTYGICYPMIYGDVPDSFRDQLDDAVLAYNMDHDAPDIAEVSQFITDYFSEESVPAGTFSFDWDGSDVCVSFYAE